MKAQIYSFLLLGLCVACSNVQDSQEEKNVKINKINYLPGEIGANTDDTSHVTINECNFVSPNISSLSIVQIKRSEPIVGGFCRNPENPYAASVVVYSVDILEHIGGDRLDETINIIEFNSIALNKYNLQEGDIVLVATRKSREEIFSWSGIKLNINSSEEQEEYPKITIDLPDTPEGLILMYNETKNNLDENCSHITATSDQEWEEYVFVNCN